MRPGPADLQKCLRNRSHFLRHLQTPGQKCELVRELDESRSTIDRALRELENAGFVARDDEGYRTTLAGKLALAEYERHAARLDGLASVGGHLTALAADEPLDAALFEAADVSLPTRQSPHEPVESLEAALADADHARVFGTTVLPSYVEMYHEKIADEGMTADLVLSERVVEWLLSRREDALLDVASTEGVTVAQTDVTHSFSLAVLESDAEPSPDRSVAVMVYDEGTLAGFVGNDTREAVAWGEALLDRIEGEATRLHVG